jgi:diketogulonate reductase-like aldo/keto reductase
MLVPWITVVTASAAPANPYSIPTVTLSNGVQMPTLIQGTGASTWMNDTSTEAEVYAGLMAGMVGVDTANHYRNQRGVAAAIARARADGLTARVWVQTKVEGCGNAVDARSPVLQGSCFNDTLAVHADNLALLNASAVDLTLLHAPPCVPGAPWVPQGCWNVSGTPELSLYPTQCDCAARVPCGMMQQQWLALEQAYKAGTTRAIGVSNYCAACLACLAEVATVAPHVNQLKFHAGMGGHGDPAGLLTYCAKQGTAVQVCPSTRDRLVLSQNSTYSRLTPLLVSTLASLLVIPGIDHGHAGGVQAYRALGGVGSSLVSDPTLKAVGAGYGKSAPQVALRYVVQRGHALVTSVDDAAFVGEDLDIFNWTLSEADRATVDGLSTHNDSVVGNMCVL